MHVTTKLGELTREQRNKAKRIAKRKLRKQCKQRNDGLRGRTKYMTAEPGKPIS